jgi:hypothetical protein
MNPLSWITNGSRYQVPENGWVAKSGSFRGEPCISTEVTKQQPLSG